MNIKLDRRGAVLSVAAIVLVSVYQSLFFLAPEFLARALWSGSFLTVAFLLGTFSVAIPVVAGWWMIQGDKADDETFDVTHH